MNALGLQLGRAADVVDGNTSCRRRSPRRPVRGAARALASVLSTTAAGTISQMARGLLSLSHEVLRATSPRPRLRGRAPAPRPVKVVHDATMPGLEEAAHHVGPHPAQPDHAQFHSPLLETRAHPPPLAVDLNTDYPKTSSRSPVGRVSEAPSISSKPRQVGGWRCISHPANLRSSPTASLAAACCGDEPSVGPVGVVARVAVAAVGDDQPAVRRAGRRPRGPAATVERPVIRPLSKSLVPSAQTWKTTEPASPTSSSTPTSARNAAYSALEPVADDRARRGRPAPWRAAGR